MKLEPGIYKATVRDVPEVTVMVHADSACTANAVADWVQHGFNDITDARPLIVLDLEDTVDAAKGLRRVAAAARPVCEWDVVDIIADQIEAQTPAGTKLSAVDRLTGDLHGARATIARVKALLPKWQAERATYPLGDPRASAAFLAVKMCHDELLTALEPVQGWECVPVHCHECERDATPAVEAEPEPDQWWVRLFCCGQDTGTEGPFDTWEKADQFRQSYADCPDAYSQHPDSPSYQPAAAHHRQGIISRSPTREVPGD